MAFRLFSSSHGPWRTQHARYCPSNFLLASWAGKPAFFARTYIIGNVKIKWGVCMRVEGEDAAMNLFGMPVGSCLLNQKIEESGRDAVACRSQSFGMELHTPYRIFVGRLYSFGNTV